MFQRRATTFIVQRILRISQRFGANLIRRTPLRQVNVIPCATFHLSASCYDQFDPELEDKWREGLKSKDEVEKWLAFNKVVYPPTEPGQPDRPAEICHVEEGIHMSRKRLWYGCVLVRGLSIEDALQQCSHSSKLAAHHIRKALIKAQDLAVKEHNVEYRSNLWVADSFCGFYMKLYSAKRTKRGRVRITHEFSNYFVRLREGTPPEHYYPPELTGNEKLEEYIMEQRQRRIYNAL